ncbi:MAG: nicotinate (nicotinamide) nucleotide adenylyltransferase [Cyclobacteriaceae bacterium]
MKKKVGLFFGSFNPVHIGHLIIANTIAQNSDLDSVQFIVSPQNPFKKQSGLAHEHDRLMMIEDAIEGIDHLSVSDVEFNMPKPSYTIDTLTYLSDKNPKNEYVLLMGQDNLTHFHKWKNYESILDLHRIYVYPRPHVKGSSFDKHEKITLLDVPLLDISATHIRKQVKENKSIRFLVAPEVESYIFKKGMYL